MSSSNTKKVNRNLVEKFIKLYNTFQTQKMIDLFTEDCVFQNISNTSGVIESRGKKELYDLAKSSIDFFSSREQKVSNWVIDENKIAVEIDYFAIVALDLPNGLKKGMEIKLKGISIYEFENSKIKRLIDFS